MTVHLSNPRPVFRLILALLATLAALPVRAGDPAYLDDRSTPGAVVRSYFNAMTLGDFPRAWSYLDEGKRPEFDAFFEFYADVESVDVKLGTATAEGAAGTVWWQVPVAIRVWTVNGVAVASAGCFTLAQPRPELTDRPPYRPITIREDALLPVLGAFDAVEGSCPA